MRFTKSLKSRKGQSLVEYLLLFLIVAVLSVALVKAVPTYFSGYVTSCTGAMQ